MAPTIHHVMNLSFEQPRLNEGRIIKPDDKLKAVLPVAKVDMLKMAGMISKHISK